MQRRFENAIYVGRAEDDQGNNYYYVGQAKNPARRWDQHLRQQTGPCQFGMYVEWAVLVWGVPNDKMGSAESYLIGYVLCKFGCVNGNRGQDEKAFAEGYKDAAAGKPPGVCPAINIDSLDWQYFDTGSADVIVDNQIEPSAETDLRVRVWGFHALDEEKVVESYLKFEKDRLEQLIREQSQMNVKLQAALSSRNVLWFVAGIALGIAFAYLRGMRI